MNATDKLQLEDVQRKNVIMVIAFSIAIVGALAVTIVNKEFNKSLFYTAGLTAYVIGYFIMKFWIKKDFWFPYYMVIVGYGTMIMYVIVFNVGLHTFGIFFFLLFLSTAQDL